jgi:glycosyltransferase involved in cell wall biosynthesis
MPAFNAEKTIEKSIESVLKQSYKDWELIVIDDGSTDNTKESVERLIKKEKRIHLITTHKNIGCALARDKGIEASNGRWIAFLDADDLWLPKKLEAQIAFQKKNKAVLTHTQYRRINQFGRLGRIIRSPSQITYKDLLKNNFIANSTILYDTKNASIEKILLGYHLYYDDYARWLNITRDHGPAACLDDVLMLYFYNAQTNSANKFKSLFKNWSVLRVSQNLSALKSIYYVLHVIVNGIKKHSRF